MSSVVKCTTYNSTVQYIHSNHEMVHKVKQYIHIALYIQEYNEIRQTFDLNYIVYTLFGLEEYCTISKSSLVMVV